MKRLDRFLLQSVLLISLFTLARTSYSRSTVEYVRAGYHDNLNIPSSYRRPVRRHSISNLANKATTFKNATFVQTVDMPMKTEERSAQIDTVTQFETQLQSMEAEMLSLEEKLDIVMTDHRRLREVLDSKQQQLQIAARNAQEKENLNKIHLKSIKKLKKQIEAQYQERKFSNSSLKIADSPRITKLASISNNCRLIKKGTWMIGSKLKYKKPIEESNSHLNQSILMNEAIIKELQRSKEDMEFELENLSMNYECLQRDFIQLQSTNSEILEVNRKHEDSIGLLQQELCNWRWVSTFLLSASEEWKQKYFSLEQTDSQLKEAFDQINRSNSHLMQLVESQQQELQFKCDLIESLKESWWDKMLRKLVNVCIRS